VTASDYVSVTHVFVQRHLKYLACHSKSFFAGGKLSDFITFDGKSLKNCKAADLFWPYIWGGYTS
jgi:hypothetical protein